MRTASLVAVLALGCGPYGPAAVKAGSYSVGAGMTAMGTVIPACQQLTWDDCKRTLLFGGIAAGTGMIGVFSGVFIEAIEEVEERRRRQAEPYAPVPAPVSAAPSSSPAPSRAPPARAPSPPASIP